MNARLLYPIFLFLTLQLNAQQQLLQELDSVFDHFMMDSEVAGINAAIQLPSDQLWQRAGGIATSRVGDSLEVTDIMAMGSITKSFIAATVLHMVEEGQLQLQETIGAYLDQYPNIDPKITIAQLLSHTSGIAEFLSDESTNAVVQDQLYIWPIDSVLLKFVGAPLFEPGSRWSYSNSNYLLLGNIIAAIDEIPWYQSVRKRVLEPIGLKETFAYPFEMPADDTLVHVWADPTGAGEVIEIQTAFDLTGYFSMAASAGCYISTTADLIKFCEAFYGGDFISNQELFRQAIAEHSLGAWDQGHYGLGIMSLPISEENINVIGHGGSILYQALALYIEAFDVSMVLYQNDERSSGRLIKIGDIDELAAALAQTISLHYRTTTAEHVNPNKYEIFPTIVQNQITIHAVEHFENSKKVQIVNLFGQHMIETDLSASKSTIDVTHLPAGTYFVSIDGVQHKIIKN